MTNIERGRSTSSVTWAARRPRCPRGMVLAVIAPIALVLAACSTTQRVGHAGAPTGVNGSSAGKSSPAAQPRRGGGYYLDDGPADHAPVDLASIPDATPRAEPLLPRTLRPYSVFGRRYTPMQALVPHRERGMASWYGRRYHGQPTSSGERYDMFAMTAAHPTLPIPSYVRVTHVGNGRSVVVRVNDRGPFLQNRVIDLSYTAAAKLGYIEAGSAEVEVETITQFDSMPVATASAASVTPARQAPEVPPEAEKVPEADEPTRLEVETVLVGQQASRVDAQAAMPRDSMPAPSLAAANPQPADAAMERGRGFWLQFGAFASVESARAALSQWASELDWLGANFDLRRDGALYKVQAGPWNQRDQALSAAERVRASSTLRPFTTFR